MKNLLALKAGILCGAMFAYANEMKNQELISLLGHSPTALYKLPDREFARSRPSYTWPLSIWKRWRIRRSRRNPDPNWRVF